MFNKIYHNYFDKNKSLRHYTQHLMVSIFSMTILVFFGFTLSSFNLILILVFSFLPDIDGLLYMIINRQLPESKLIINFVKKHEFIKAATTATIFHKKFNKLFIHNILALLIILGLFLYSLYCGNIIYISILDGILFHFLFDILDDLYQLGHINNWLWPLR